MKQLNFSQIPNEYLDNMAKYSPGTTLVFLAIYRKTMGSNKSRDHISYSEFEKLTGLSVNTIKKSIEELIINKWIIQERIMFSYAYGIISTR